MFYIKYFAEDLSSRLTCVYWYVGLYTETLANMAMTSWRFQAQ